MNNALSTANLHDMPQLPFELVLEIAAFCAGSFNFKTFLALALICRQAHTCLKPVLAQTILVITELDFESGSIHRVNGEHIKEGRVPERWRNMQFVILLMGSSTIEQRRKQFVGVSAQMSSIFPTLIASIHQYDNFFNRPGAWSLVLQRLLPTPLAAAILRYLPLAFDDLNFRGTVVEAEAPKLVTMMKSLSVHIFNHALCEGDMEGSTEPECNSPICMSLSVSPDSTWIALEQSDAGNCLAMCCKIAASYSSLGLFKDTKIPLDVMEAAGERRIIFSVLRQYRSLLLAHPEYISSIHLAISPVARKPVWIDAALDTMFDFYMCLPAVRECQRRTTLLAIDGRCLEFYPKGPSIARVDYTPAVNLLDNRMSPLETREAFDRMFQYYPMRRKLEPWVEPMLPVLEDEEDDRGEGFAILAQPEEAIVNDDA